MNIVFVRIKLTLILLNSFILINTNINNKVIILGIPKCGTLLANAFYESYSKKSCAIIRLVKEGILKNYYKGDFNALVIPQDAHQLFQPSLEILEKSVEFNENEFLTCHLTYKKEYEDLLKKNNIKILFIIRDPRDQLVSRAYYTHNHLAYPGLKHLTISELISSFMGFESEPNQKFEDLYTSHICYLNKPQYKAISNISKFYQGYLPWMKSSICHTIKFEDLVENSIETIKKVLIFLDEPFDHKFINEVIKKMIGNSSSFREGKTGAWRKEFTEQQKLEFKKIAGNMLIDLGYEKNNNW